MSEFASYCIFVRDQQISKQAGMGEDLLQFAKENPATAGALGGGALGGISGMFSDRPGSVLRNAAIGAGLGGLGGGAYGMSQGMYGGKEQKELMGPPESIRKTEDLVNATKPAPPVSGTALPGVSSSWEKETGLPEKKDPDKIVSPEAKGTTNPDDITKLTTAPAPFKSLLNDPGSPTAEAGGFKPGAPLKEHSVKEVGQARAAKRNDLTSQINSLVPSLGLDPKIPEEKKVLDMVAQLQPAGQATVDPNDLASAESLLGRLDTAKSTAGKPFDALGKGWDAVSSIPGKIGDRVGGALDSIQGANEAKQRAAEMAAKLKETQGDERAAGIQQLLRLLQEAKGN